MLWGAYAVSDDVNIPVWNLLVESGHMRLQTNPDLKACIIKMEVMCVTHYNFDSYTQSCVSACAGTAVY